jgi:hypothetical protein
MTAPRTLPMSHFIIPDGQESAFSWTGISDGVFHQVEPFRLMNGTEWCVPAGVLNITEMPQTLKDSLLALESTRQLTCCDFKACNHVE